MAIPLPLMKNNISLSPSKKKGIVIICRGVAIRLSLSLFPFRRRGDMAMPPSLKEEESPLRNNNLSLSLEEGDDHINIDNGKEGCGHPSLFLFRRRYPPTP